MRCCCDGNGRTSRQRGEGALNDCFSSNTTAIAFRNIGVGCESLSLLTDFITEISPE